MRIKEKKKIILWGSLKKEGLTKKLLYREDCLKNGGFDSHERLFSQ